MKLINLILILNITNVNASETIRNETIHIDGDSQKQMGMDEEMDFFKNELRNIKNLNSGFKKKSVILSKMSEVAEDLSESHNSYVEERNSYEEIIQKYNNQRDCLNKKNGSECQNRKKVEKGLFIFDRALRENTHMFKTCYQRVLQDTAFESSGKINVIFKNGNIEKVHLSKSDDNEFDECIVSSITSFGRNLNLDINDGDEYSTKLNFFIKNSSSLE
ncbi:hypothetical protein A9Q84_00170 [Halobacteriovorax marinus]|uniref:Uncharacterized protein n=1 Tax=Halobacteriovorax marinus TaxID=97084 RepID=A0A1Y5FIT5_9BACT|nr:hypothetical protein A9Q84_00170 [Halobacteriovorax marinus]